MGGPAERSRWLVSIHAAREGGDLMFSPLRLPLRSFQSTPPARAATSYPGTGVSPSLFQSTPPARAATRNIPCSSCTRTVSIHAAREGGDVVGAVDATGLFCFNPRRPRGRRLDLAINGTTVPVFQSTPPARAATITAGLDNETRMVSIHAAREGGDDRRRWSTERAKFQSTPPARAATHRTPRQ